MIKRIVSILITVVLLLMSLPLSATAANLQSEKIQSFFLKNSSYNNYIKKNPVSLTGEAVSIDVQKFSPSSSGVKAGSGDTEGMTVTESDSIVEYSFTISKSGSYAIQIEYLPIAGADSNITRNIYIDGKLPFDESYNVEFYRTFRDKSGIITDKNNYDSRPEQEEVFEKTTAFVKDSNGYYGKLWYYLEAGTHVLKLEAAREPMAIGAITLISKDENIPDYKTALKEYESKGAKKVTGALQNGVLKVEAESPYRKSDTSLYAIADSSSAGTTPYAYDRQKLNTIGDTKWQTAGQWISWQIDVPEDGLYNLGFRFKQSFSRDVNVSRTLYIDGAVPFKEAQTIEFKHADKFQVMLAGGNDPYWFYLKKGKHEIKLEVSLGHLAEILTDGYISLSALNSANWYMLALMGSSPDVYKDYNIDTQLPNVMEILREQEKEINRLAKEWEELSGSVDSNVSALQQIAFRLEKMVKSPDKIPSMYSTFKDDISNLGDLLMTAAQQPVLLDCLFISEKDAELPQADVGFFTRLKFGVLRFMASFTNDYSSIRTANDTDTSKMETITVWIGSGATGGRDQANALNQLVSTNFTAVSNIAVNMQLVAGGTVLLSTLAGTGPDVALQTGGTESVEFAMRSATVDFSKFEDFEQIKGRFFPAAFDALTYNGGVYAIPETFSYNMMFYRTDIMEMLEIDADDLKTWDDVIAVLPIMQKMNMNFALPAAYDTFVSMLYQRGGEVYDEKYTKTILDEKLSLDTFDYFMNLYTSYGMPYQFSFVNRFRTGEMPIGVADYTTYNTLQISAPEIKGKWKMVPIPGTRDENGNINNTSSTGTSGCVMMSQSKHKDAAWEFIKWWTDSDAQYKFGRELESVLGMSARYNTANIKALQRLPWSTADLNGLMLQAKNTKGIPNIPGGYITSRNVGFSIASVYNENIEARRNLLEYIDLINDEIEFKREEFGLN